MGKVVLPRSAVSPVVGVTPVKRATEVNPAGPAEEPEATGEPDLRLIIEESEEAGGVVYMMVDRKTGKVVSRMTREEVLRLRDKASYAGGAVYDGKA